MLFRSEAITVANTINTLCTVNNIGEPATNCSIIQVTPGGQINTVVSSGNLTCQLTGLFLPTPQPASTSNEGYYAFLATQSVFAFPYTPDPINLSSCSLFYCDAPVKNSTAWVCDATDFANVPFESFNISATFADNVEVIPLVALSKVRNAG